MIRILVLVLLLAPWPAEAKLPSLYDKQIRQAAERWLPGWPWKIWKAQLVAESGLDPNAVSPVGATGLSQMMPGTWLEVSAALGWRDIDRRDAAASIEGGAWYLAKLARQWSAPRPWGDRAKLSQASYNAGLGNVLRAQQACANPALYDEIIICLPSITGHHSRETITYVARIWRLWRQIEALD